MFYFHPYLGKIPNLTNIFQRGWNHQLDYQSAAWGKLFRDELHDHPPAAALLVDVGASETHFRAAHGPFIDGSCMSLGFA